jgi:hypothetical protein
MTVKIKINNINKKILLRVIIVVVGVASPAQWLHTNDSLVEQPAIFNMRMIKDEGDENEDEDEDEGDLRPNN